MITGLGLVSGLNIEDLISVISSVKGEQILVLKPENVPEHTFRGGSRAERIRIVETYKQIEDRSTHTPTIMAHMSKKGIIIEMLIIWTLLTAREIDWNRLWST